MLGKLISLNKNGHETTEFPVASLHLFIGSDSYCDLRIKNKNVSPQHCLITSQKDKPALIRNMSRTAPTLVNGTEIGSKDVELQDQDIITICHKKYKWKYDSSHKMPDKNLTESGIGRKSWPPSNNKLVAVVTPMRDEGREGTDKVEVRAWEKDLPLKKRRATIGAEKFKSSVKKHKVLGIKPGVRGARKLSGNRKSSVKISPAKVQITSVPASGRKSVKFSDSVYVKKLGKRGKLFQGPPTPYRPSIGTGKGKASLYFTPPSTLIGGTPRKGILKTPGTDSKNQSTKSRVQTSFPDLRNTACDLPSSSQLPESDESGLHTPPMDESLLPEIVMRSSKRSASRRGLSSPPESTPKSASKSNARKDSDGSLEASERAAKKLKKNPPVAIDKKKMAALLQCHRKSLTPHPMVNARGRLFKADLPSPTSKQEQTSPPGTPTSGKKRGKPRKSPAIPFSNIVPKVLRFGSLGNNKADHKEKKLERSFIMKAPVAKMLSSSLPLERKMTRATRAARSLNEPVKKEATDVLSALDLSRKIPIVSETPEPLRKPTSPIADYTSDSGIKELFSSDRTLDVRELFLEKEESLNRSSLRPKISNDESPKQSRRSSLLKSPEPSTSKSLPSTPAPLTSPIGSTSRRSLTLKGSRSPAASTSVLLNDFSKSSSSKRKSVVSPASQGSLNESNFSLGSFNASAQRSVNSTVTPSPSLGRHSPTPLQKSISGSISKVASKSHSLSSIKKPRQSLRRTALSASTPKVFRMSDQEFSTIGKIHHLDITIANSSERSLPLKKRSIISVVNVGSSTVANKTPDVSTLNTSSPAPRNVGRAKKPLSTNKSQKEKRSSSISVGDISHLSNESLKVHPGSVGKSMNDTSLSSVKASRTVSLGGLFSPNSTSLYVKDKSMKGNFTSPTALKSKSTRSSTSVNIDLFGLDKFPFNVPSSTPLKIQSAQKIIEVPKRTRSKSSVKINLFDLDGSSKKVAHRSLLVKRSTPMKGRITKSLSPLKGKSRKADNIEPVSKDQKSKALVGSSNISQKQFEDFHSNISFKGKEENSIIHPNKSTRSKSSVNIDLFKLDDVVSSPVIKKSHRSKSAENVSKKSVSHLYTSKRSLEANDLSVHTPPSNSTKLSKSINSSVKSDYKSTRSNSSVNINIFRLDDNESRKSFISPSKEKSLGKANKSITLSPSKLEGSKLQESSQRHRFFSPKSPKKSISEESQNVSMVNKSSSVEPFASKSTLSMANTSTRSKSSVNIDLFKLDEQPLLPATESFRKDKSFSHSIDRKSDTSSVSLSKSILGKSPNYDQFKKASPLQKANKTSTSSPRNSVNKSTRSNASVDINLFKLDEQPLTPAIKTPSKDRSFTSKVYRKSDKSSTSSVKYSIENLKGASNTPLKKTSPIAKSTRGSSFVDIDLFKLDEQPLTPAIKTPSKDKSFTNKSYRKSDEPGTSSVKYSIENLKGASNTPLKKTSPIAKSTRGSSFVDIDLFKLDEQPLTPAVKTPSKDKSFTNKSYRKSDEPGTSSVKYSIENLKGASNTPLKKTSPIAKSTRGSSFVDIDLFKLDEQPLTPAVKTPSKDKSFTNKSYRKSDEPGTSSGKSSSENLTVVSKTPLKKTSLITKSTRGNSFVDIDLFKLDEKPLTPAVKTPSKDKSFTNKSYRKSDDPDTSSGKSSSENLTAVSKTPLIKTSPITKSTRGSSFVDIDLFKLDEKPLTPAVKTPSKYKSFTKKSYKKSDDPGTSSGKSSSDNLTAVSSNEKSAKSTRSSSKIDTNLFSLDKSPLRVIKTSPNLKALGLSPKLKLKNVSAATSPFIFQSLSPRVVLKCLPSTSTQHTQTSPEKNNAAALERLRNLDLLSKLPIVNFANNTTPVCDYQSKTKSLATHRGRRSLRQKEIDESQRTPEMNISDKTPLSAFSPKGQRSVSEKFTDVNKSRSPVKKKSIKQLSTPVNAGTSKVSPLSHTRSQNSANQTNSKKSSKSNDKGKPNELVKMTGKVIKRSTNDIPSELTPSPPKKAKKTKMVQGKRTSLVFIDLTVETNSRGKQTVPISPLISSSDHCDKVDSRNAETSKPGRSRHPKVVALKTVNKPNKVVSTSIIKTSPLITRSTRRNPGKIISTSEGIGEASTTKSTRKGKTLPLHPSPTKIKRIRSPIKEASPRELFKSLIQIDSSMKPPPTGKHIRCAKESPEGSPETSLPVRRRGRPAKTNVSKKEAKIPKMPSPVVKRRQVEKADSEKPVASTVTKRGRPKRQETEIQDTGISSVSAPAPKEVKDKKHKIEKQEKVSASSPSPVARRGRSKHVAEKKESAASPFERRGRSAKPVLEKQKTPKTCSLADKRVKGVKNEPVNLELVTSPVAKRGRTKKYNSEKQGTESTSSLSANAKQDRVAKALSIKEESSLMNSPPVRGMTTKDGSRKQKSDTVSSPKRRRTRVKAVQKSSTEKEATMLEKSKTPSGKRLKSGIEKQEPSTAPAPSSPTKLRAGKKIDPHVSKVSRSVKKQAPPNSPSVSQQGKRGLKKDVASEEPSHKRGKTRKAANLKEEVPGLSVSGLRGGKVQQAKSKQAKSPPVSKQSPSPGVRRGRPARHQDSVKISSKISKALSKKSTENSKVKANLKTAMKSTKKKRSIVSAAAVKEILKSGSKTKGGKGSSKKK